MHVLQHAVTAISVILASQIVRHAIVHSLCYLCSCRLPAPCARAVQLQCRARSFEQTHLLCAGSCGPQPTVAAIVAYLPEQEGGTIAGQAPADLSSPLRRCQLLLANY